MHPLRFLIWGLNKWNILQLYSAHCCLLWNSLPQWDSTTVRRMEEYRIFKKRFAVASILQVLWTAKIPIPSLYYISSRRESKEVCRSHFRAYCLVPVTAQGEIVTDLWLCGQILKLPSPSTCLDIWDARELEAHQNNWINPVVKAAEDHLPTQLPGPNALRWLMESTLSIIGHPYVYQYILVILLDSNPENKVILTADASSP